MSLLKYLPSVQEVAVIRNELFVLIYWKKVSPRLQGQNEVLNLEHEVEQNVFILAKHSRRPQMFL